jgi:hypothetical protein
LVDFLTEFEAFLVALVPLQLLILFLDASGAGVNLSLFRSPPDFAVINYFPDLGFVEVFSLIVLNLKVDFVMLVDVSHRLFAMLSYVRRDSQLIHLLLCVF